MKKIFTKEFIMIYRGCYSIDRVNALSFINKKVITIYDIAYSEISVSDLRWFLYTACLPALGISIKIKMERLEGLEYDENFSGTKITNNEHNRNIIIKFIDNNI